MIDDHPRFSEALRRSAEPAWTAATSHRFTRALADDTLPDAVFRRYLVQDFVFVETLTSFVAFAVARAPTMAEKKRLSGFLGVLTGDENTYFERSFEALGVSAKERQRAEPGPVTADLRTLMLETAEAGNYPEILAILTAAEWVYLTWATNATKGADGAGRAPARFYYQDWIDLHATPEFAGFVGWLRAELDRLGPALSAEARERLAALFRRTAELEAAFFDAAYVGDR